MIIIIYYILMSINLEKIVLDSPICMEIKDIKNTYILTTKIYINNYKG